MMALLSMMHYFIRKNLSSYSIRFAVSFNYMDTIDRFTLILKLMRNSTAVLGKLRPYASAGTLP